MSMSPPLDKSEMAALYRGMALIRRFEEAGALLYAQGKIRGPLHPCIGQEAVAVGAASVLREGDYVFGHHRGLGHALAAGMDPKAVMAELCGKADGSNGGRAGPTGVSDPSRGFMGGSPHPGGRIPIAVGMALSCMLKDEGRAVVCFFGEGAAAQGVLHESMNMASLWKLPIVFFMENNLHGMGSRVDSVHAGSGDLYRLADAYRMPSAQVDGMDPLAVRSAAEVALGRARSGAGPVLLEALTYRFEGHSTAEADDHRDPSEVEQWRARDPLETLKALAMEQDALGQEDVYALDQQAASEVEEAVRFVDESPVPSADSLGDNVYAPAID